MSQGRVMQIGEPEEIYHHPGNAFVAEFLGVSNVLRGKVDPDGKGVTVAGVCLPYQGEPGTAVTVVFKADEARITGQGTEANAAVVFAGKLIEVFFIGSLYRHYVNVNGEMLLVDSLAKVAQPDVRVMIPNGKMQIYPAS
jgi:ABC-type Fe3+/spermidine/putrescine transport system ATPase subunit